MCCCVTSEFCESEHPKFTKISKYNVSFWWCYVQKIMLCSEDRCVQKIVVFRRCYVQKMLCSEGVVFRRWCCVRKMHWMGKESVMKRWYSIKIQNERQWCGHKGIGLNKISHTCIDLKLCCVHEIMLCSWDTLKWSKEVL